MSLLAALGLADVGGVPRTPPSPPPEQGGGGPSLPPTARPPPAEEDPLAPLPPSAEAIQARVADEEATEHDAAAVRCERRAAADPLVRPWALLQAEGHRAALFGCRERLIEAAGMLEAPAGPTIFGQIPPAL